MSFASNSLVVQKALIKFFKPVARKKQVSYSSMRTLDEKFFVLYWKGTPDDLKDLGGSEYYFGGAADPVKVQAILDSIEFE